MRASSPRKVRAAVAALVLMATLGAAPVYGDHRYGFGLMFGGPYVGFGGYGGGLYLGAGGYGGGLTLGLGGHSGDVIVGVGGHGGVPYSYVLPGVPAGGVTTAPVLSVPSYYGATVAPVPPVISPVPPVAASGYTVQPLAPATVLPGGSRTIGALSAENVNDEILRVTWRDDGSGAREVTLFLADAARKTLAQQTVRAAPFTAVFERVPGAAYVGVTRHYADGVEATTVMPVPAAALPSETELPLR